MSRAVHSEISLLLRESEFLRTARIRRETGLMRLLTAMVSGGTRKLLFPVLAKI